MKFHGVEVCHCGIPVDGAVAGAEEEVTFHVLGRARRAVRVASSIACISAGGRLRAARAGKRRG